MRFGVLVQGARVSWEEIGYPKSVVLGVNGAFLGSHRGVREGLCVFNISTEEIMKVTNLEIFDIYFEEEKIIQPYWHPIIMRVHTDEGITGLGEVGLAYGTGHSAAVGMAKNMVENFTSIQK